MNKGLKGVKGPGMEAGNSVQLDLPDCVVIKTVKDQTEFQEFVGNIIKAANKEALNQIAVMVEKNNQAMAELVKRLGPS